jgi:hypothetical protein
VQRGKEFFIKKKLLILINEFILEQYWTWNCLPNWTQREKIFLIVIIVLSVCLLAMTSVFSVIVEHYLKYRHAIFGRSNEDAGNVI